MWWSFRGFLVGAGNRWRVCVPCTMLHAVNANGGGSYSDWCNEGMIAHTQEDSNHTPGGQPFTNLRSWVVCNCQAFPKHAPMELPPLKQDILIEYNRAQIHIHTHACTNTPRACADPTCALCTTQKYNRSLPQTYFYVVNVLLSFMSMAIVNVPLFLCLRRTSLLFVLVAEFYVLHKVPSRLTQCVLK